MRGASTRGDSRSETIGMRKMVISRAVTTAKLAYAHTRTPVFGPLFVLSLLRYTRSTRGDKARGALFVVSGKKAN